MLNGEAPVVNTRSLGEVRSHAGDVVEKVKAGIEKWRRLEAGRWFHAAAIPVKCGIQPIGSLRKTSIEAVGTAATAIAQCLVIDPEAAAQNRFIAQTVCEP